MAEKGGAPDRGGPALLVWIDAQLPPALAGWLRTEHGADAVHVEELGLHRARDPVIFAAARGQDRVVVVLTKDDDFRKLLGQHGPPPRVVWVRCGNVTNQELRRILCEAWPRTEVLLAAGEALVEIRRRSQ
jgi:predicted nuclease of predicted toxin-antitoxin system